MIKIIIIISFVYPRQYLSHYNASGAKQMPEIIHYMSLNVSYRIQLND